MVRGKGDRMWWWVAWALGLDKPRGRFGQLGVLGQGTWEISVYNFSDYYYRSINTWSQICLGIQNNSEFTWVIWYVHCILHTTLARSRIIKHRYNIANILSNWNKQRLYVVVCQFSPDFPAKWVLCYILVDWEYNTYYITCHATSSYEEDRNSANECITEWVILGRWHLTLAKSSLFMYSCHMIFHYFCTFPSFLRPAP